jgi:hypothetical protein
MCAAGVRGRCVSLLGGCLCLYLFVFLCVLCLCMAFTETLTLRIGRNGSVSCEKGGTKRNHNAVTQVLQITDTGPDLIDP